MSGCLRTSELPLRSETCTNESERAIIFPSFSASMLARAVGQTACTHTCVRVSRRQAPPRPTCVQLPGCRDAHTGEKGPSRLWCGAACRKRTREACRMCSCDTTSRAREKSSQWCSVREVERNGLETIVATRFFSGFFRIIIAQDGGERWQRLSFLPIAILVLS